MYVIGLDLGTSALKGLVVDQSGKLVAEATAGYPLSTPQVGFSEQDPNDWLRAADQVLTDLIKQLPELKEKLVGISFSGQMHSLVLLDEANQPLRPAILWNDVRTTAQCQALTAKIGPMVLNHTKNVILEGFTLPKIRWVQENEPEIWQQVKQIQLPKDYLRFWLTGKFHMDYSDAAGTLLLNQDTQEWDQEILEAVNIDPTILPPLVASTAVVGTVKPELAECFGFTQAVQVIAGGADNACAAVGAGIVAPGIGMCSIGTSGVFLRYEDSAAKEYAGKLHLFAHAAEEVAYSMGVTLAAGSSLSWFKDTFAPEASFETLLGEIASVAPGSDGLLFTPYIVGERTPYSDSKIRGSFIGMDIHHRLSHFARSVLEGITFSLKDSQEIMAQATNEGLAKIVSVGGGAKNKEWLQMQANIFNTPITTLTTEQGPGMGAAMLAAVGCNWYPNVASCAADFVTYASEYLPDPTVVATYEEVYRRYRMIYPATKPICDAY